MMASGITVLIVATGVCGLLALWALAQALKFRGVLATLRRLAFAATFAALGALLGMLLWLLQAFSRFSDETLVAQVTARWLSRGEFELTYVPTNPPTSASAEGESIGSSEDHVGPSGQRGGGGTSQTVRLEGDQWMLSGGIVKWHPWLTTLGLASYHKPMRLAGQFSRLDEQRLHLPTVFPLEPRADQLWEALYWAGSYLPFIDAVYGSSAYVYVESGVVYDISVTPSGYLIKRRIAEGR